jgi:hypothetical protein
MTKERVTLPGEIGRWTSAVSANALNGIAAAPFVIPSEAEGSAVQRTSLGNVFQPTI